MLEGALLFCSNCVGLGHKHLSSLDPFVGPSLPEMSRCTCVDVSAHSPAAGTFLCYEYVLAHQGVDTSSSTQLPWPSTRSILQAHRMGGGTGTPEPWHPDSPHPPGTCTRASSALEHGGCVPVLTSISGRTLARLALLGLAASSRPSSSLLRLGGPAPPSCSV